MEKLTSCPPQQQMVSVKACQVTEAASLLLVRFLFRLEISFSANSFVDKAVVFKCLGRQNAFNSVQAEIEKFR